jgi:ABC-2 type transport system permease protein
MHPRVIWAIIRKDALDIWLNKSTLGGLIVPANFDSPLRAGNRPVLSLFLNGSTVNAQTEALLQTAIINYARAIANPQPPVTITTAVINPPSSTSTGAPLAQVYTPLVLLLSLIVGTTIIPLLLLEEKAKKTLRMLLVTPASFMDILIGSARDHLGKEY